MSSSATGSRKRHKKRHGDSPGSDRQQQDDIEAMNSTLEQQKLIAFTARDEALRALATCKVCFRMLYEPYTLGCGHTYCYSCLCQWFQNSTRNKKTCPDCRTLITRQPAPAYALREVVRELLNRGVLLPDAETTAEHDYNRDEEAALVEQDRNNGDAAKGGLFKGTFAKSGAQMNLVPIHDPQDNVMRCPRCTWELEGQETLGCVNCGLEFMNSDEEAEWSVSGSDLTLGSGDEDDELDADLDMNDADFEASIAAMPHSDSIPYLDNYYEDDFDHTPPVEDLSNRPPGYETGGESDGNPISGTFDSDIANSEEDESDLDDDDEEGSLDGFVVGDDDGDDEGDEDDEGSDSGNNSDGSERSNSTTVPHSHAVQRRSEPESSSSNQRRSVSEFRMRPKIRRVVDSSSEEEEDSQESDADAVEQTSSVDPSEEEDEDEEGADIYPPPRAPTEAQSRLAWRFHDDDVNDASDEMSDESALDDDDEEGEVEDDEDDDDDINDDDDDHRQPDALFWRDGSSVPTELYEDSGSVGATDFDDDDDDDEDEEDVEEEEEEE